MDIGVTFEPLPSGSHNVIVRCGREFVLVIDGDSAMIKGTAKRGDIDAKIQRSHQECIIRAIAQEFPQIETVVWERAKCGIVRNVAINLDGYR